MLYKKKWTLKHFGKIKENKVGIQVGISPEISQILKNRDIITEKDAEIFMNPSLDYLRDPFLMKDMQKGVDRIKKAIEKKERIFIYGDYDVDGVSSTSILVLYFKSIGYDVKYYIPNRLKEGYGISIEALEKIKRFLAVIIAGVMGITFAISTFAEEAADEKNGAFKVYMDELSRINEELGTHYGIPVEYFDESELEEAKQFFSEMSIDEFRDYIYTIHYNSVNNIRSVQERFEENKLVPTVAVSVDGGWRYSLILGQGAVLSVLAANIDREIIFGDSI